MKEWDQLLAGFETEKIEFSDLFDKEQIQKLQDSFSIAHGLGSIITLPNGEPVTEPSNFCELCCNIIRKTEEGYRRCVRSDSIIGAYNPTAPTIRKCLSAGLVDCGVSISINGKHLANWLIGQVRYDDMDIEVMADNAARIGVDRQEYISALQKVPVVSEEKFQKIADLLYLLAHEISEKAFFNLILKKQLNAFKEQSKLIKESETMFRSAQKAAMIGSFRAQLFDNLSWVATEEFDQILGLEASDASIRDTWLDFIHPDERQPMLDYIKKEVFHERKPMKKEFRIVKRNTDETRWILALGNFEYCTTGNPLTFAGTIQDITELKRNEELIRRKNEEINEKNRIYKELNNQLESLNQQLEASEETYRRLFESITDSVFIKEANNEGGLQKFIKVNDVACKRLGYSMEELLNKNILDIHSEKTRHKIADIYHNTIKNGSYTTEVEHVTKDGLLFPVELSTSSFQLKGKTYIHAIARDISKRVAAEAQNRMLKYSLDIFTDGIYWMNNSNRIVYVNEAGARQLGYSINEILGMHLLDINSSFTKAGLRDLWYKLRNDGSYNGEIIHKREDGTEIIFEVHSVYVLFEGNEYCNGFARDITERIQFEKELITAKDKAEESDRLKTAFLQNMSHEIRTPLNAILGFAELLTYSYEERAVLEEYTDIIKERGNDLLAIIEDIFDIAKIESGHVEIFLSEKRIGDMVEEIKRFFIQQCKHKNKDGVELRFNLQCLNNQTVIRTDVEKLKQILFNLLANAIKYTDSGHIELGCYFEKKQLLTFYVSDTGIGIHKDDQQRVFERFVQIEPCKNRLYGGKGLGLAITKGLVEAMGGKIWIESEPGAGSTFTFSMPGEVAEILLESDTSEKSIAESAKKLADKKFLLVEDDIHNARFIKEFLQKMPAEVCHVISGTEAIEKVLNFNPDLVLLDLGLPDISGFEVAKRLLQIAPETKIIAQSAYVTPADIKKAFESGCIDFLSKPIHKDIAVSLIAKHVL